MAAARLEDITGAHIVFCSMVDSVVHLDCLTTSDGIAGWPFTLVVSVPQGCEWSSLAAATLARWMTDSRELELGLMEHRAPPRLRIADGQTVLRLDVVGVFIESMA